MIKNYFKTAWRNLVKNKFNSSVNVLGLMVAFTCCILLLLTVYYEYSYDIFHKNLGSLYHVYDVSYTPNGDKKSGTMSYPTAPTIKAEVPGVIKSTAIMYGGFGIRYKGKEVDKMVSLVDNDFFSMFTFPIVAGNKVSPLESMGNVVLSEPVAAALFNKENPIGKEVEVKLSGEWKTLIVSSVIAESPNNSSIHYDAFARIELGPNYAESKNDWQQQHHPVYIQLGPGVTQGQVEKGLRAMVKKYHLADDKLMASLGYHKDANGDRFAYKIYPYAAMHFLGAGGPGNAVSETYLQTLILIAIIVLVIACFNFINLNIARAFTRAREVGVRKTIGAGKRQIFVQLWLESLLLCLVALTLALGLSSVLLKPFNQLFTERLNMAILDSPIVIVSTIVGVLIVSVLAGGYPAWVVSRFNIVQVLKGKVSVNRSVYLRNSLITFQFVMASLLICSTFVIYSQFEHLRTAPLGFEQESVISIPIKKPENSGQYIQQLRARLASNPEVTSISGSASNIGIGEDKSQSTSAIGFDYKDKHISTNMMTVDYDFLKTIGIKTVAGRDFNAAYASDTSHNPENVIVTESVAKQFGVKDALGLTLADTSGPSWRIVGIIPDFHLYGMNQEQVPITFSMNKGNQLSYILVKVKTTNPIQTMDMVKTNYKAIEPDSYVNPSYLTDNTRRWYEREERLSSIFFASAAIAVLLSCLGLFAIVSLVIEQRKKEIGIRKVVGASVSQITAILSKDFIKLVAIAFVIATPIAWYCLNQWLQNFAYHINIGWWLFPAAGLLVLAIAAVTISFKAIRASMANPVNSLKTE